MVLNKGLNKEENYALDDLDNSAGIVGFGLRICRCGRWQLDPHSVGVGVGRVGDPVNNRASRGTLGIFR